MQLTHPAFLVLASPAARSSGSKSLKTIASTAGATDDELLVGVRAGVLPDLPRQQEGAELGHLRVCASGLDVLDPIEDPLPESFLRATQSDHPRTRRCGPSTSQRTAANVTRAIARLTFDEAVGLQWALVGRRYGELSESGPAAPYRTTVSLPRCASSCRSN